MFANTKQNIPELFMEIMRNDDVIAHYMSLPAVPLFETIELLERKKSLIRDAEKMLKWNADKGNQA
jgi:phosphoenolpyruvate carboxylase